MPTLKNKLTDADRTFWRHVENTAEHVRSSPEYTKHAPRVRERESVQTPARPPHTESPNQD